MALDSATYLVTREVAMRSGAINSRYRTADGRFILSNKDLSTVRLTSEEYLTGLKGVERISEGDAQRLIAENHFQRGMGNISYYEPQAQVQEEVVETPETTEEVTDEAPTEQPEENENESNNEKEEEE